MLNKEILKPVFTNFNRYKMCIPNKDGGECIGNSVRGVKL